jgi:hypothetical protein
MPKIRFGEETLGLIVRNRQGLRVPINQRSYAWKPSNVEDLFTDLNGAITANAEEYFLGTIIVVAPDKADFIEVYDGQQRIATTMILLAAIRDFFFLTLKDKKEAGVITTKSLISVERRGKEIPHFTLSAADRAVFVARVLREPDHPDRKSAVPDPKKESHELIDEAAKAAAEHVKAITRNLPSEVQASTLHRWIDYLENNARVIWVEVQDQATAYRIFETMNDRGLKLSAADLVKNYLYSLVSDAPPDQVTNKWQSMSAVLESLGREVGAVRTVTVPTASLARYYLRKLQIVADGNKEPQYTPSADTGVTLEHILPQKPGADWELPPELMQALFNRLGNQALLSGSTNSRIGNTDFATKIKALASSPFSLTNSVARVPSWGEKEISDRQNTLAELAKTAWPFLA